MFVMYVFEFCCSSVVCLGCSVVAFHLPFLFIVLLWWFFLITITFWNNNVIKHTIVSIRKHYLQNIVYEKFEVAVEKVGLFFAPARHNNKQKCCFVMPVHCINKILVRKQKFKRFKFRTKFNYS